MCTLVIFRRPRHRRPELIGGLDILAGGSWLGINDWGVAAAVLNRHGSLGPAPDRRSRGELVLEALDHADATAAADALSDLDPEAYRTFNLIVADESHGFWLRHAGGPRIELRPLKEGLSMIAASDLDDLATRRLELALPAFRAWPVPDPDHNDWFGWQSLLGSTRAPPNEPATAAMRFRTGGYGTVSSALIALPARGEPERRPVFRFAEWLPHTSAWCDVMSAP